MPRCTRPCKESFDLCGPELCVGENRPASARALRLPLCPRSGPHPRFAYLLTLAGTGTPRELPDYGDYEDYRSGSPAETELFVVTWKVRTEGFFFNEGGTFLSNRNFLLEQALRKEEERGCRYTYYIFIDEHLPKLRYDEETAAIDGIDTTRPPNVAFRALLDEWSPAVAVGKYHWMLPRGQTSIGGESARTAYSIMNFDHAMVAIHATAARLLLPFHTSLEAMHWIYGQELAGTHACSLYLEHVHYYPAFLVGPKIPHASSTVVKNDDEGRAWIKGLMAPYLKAAMVKNELLWRRVWPFDDGLIRVPQAALKAPPDVRYDVDITPFIRLGQPLWLQINAFWEAYGSETHLCGGGLCDLRDEARQREYTDVISSNVYE